MEFLRAEQEKSLTGDYTPDCRVHGCQKCGACDFKEIRPVVQCKLKSHDENGENERIDVIADAPEEKSAARRPDKEKSSGNNQPHHWYRLFYAKQGDIRFLSHLEMIQVFFQAFRRAGVKLHYTQGFNPVPKASFSPALPVGTESLAEYLDVDLTEALTAESEFLLRVNEMLPAGIAIRSVAVTPDKKTAAVGKNRTAYAISLDRDLSAEDRENLKNFMDCDSFNITKMRKGRQRTLDIRKQVESFVVSGENSLDMVLLSQEGISAGKPVEILKAVLDLTEDECLDMSILKVWSKSA
jgi:radical SAM-linked protein